MYRSRIADVSSLQIFFFSFASFASYLRQQREFQSSIFNSPLLKPQLALPAEEDDKVDHDAFGLLEPPGLRQVQHICNHHMLHGSVWWIHVENRWDAWLWFWPGEWFECKCAFAFEQEKHRAETLAGAASLLLPLIDITRLLWWHDGVMESCNG